MTEYGAVCTDFYINQKLSVKLDLPPSREAVSDMFERVRKEHPSLDRLRRMDEELSLESKEDNGKYRWIALRRTTLRSGVVNPEELNDAYALHQLVLELCPYYLSVRPIDIDFVELMFGFDLHAPTNRNEIVMEALFGGTPFSKLVSNQEEETIDLQPFLGFDLGQIPSMQAFVEIKTRTTDSEISSRRWSEDPISVYMTVRRLGPLRPDENLGDVFGALAGYSEKLSEDRVLPYVVHPIYKVINGI